MEGEKKTSSAFTVPYYVHRNTESNSAPLNNSSAHTRQTPNMTVTSQYNLDCSFLLLTTFSGKKKKTMPKYKQCSTSLSPWWVMCTHTVTEDLHTALLCGPVVSL